MYSTCGCLYCLSCHGIICLFQGDFHHRELPRKPRTFFKELKRSFTWISTRGTKISSWISLLTAVLTLQKVLARRVVPSDRLTTFRVGFPYSFHIISDSFLPIALALWGFTLREALDWARLVKSRTFLMSNNHQRCGHQVLISHSLPLFWRCIVNSQRLFNCVHKYSVQCQSSLINFPPWPP